MIYYFQKSLKSFIKVKIEEQNCTSTSFKKIVQKTVNIKAKIGLRSNVIVWDLDFYYLRGYYLSYNTFAKV